MPVGQRRIRLTQKYRLAMTETENRYVKFFAEQDHTMPSYWVRRIVVAAIRERIAQARQQKAS